MFKLKNVNAGLILLIILGISFISCTKSSKDLKNATQAIDENPYIPDTSISESNQDLFNVNYKDFYDELSQHGKWIQVNGKDYGITPKDNMSGQIDNKAAFLYNVFGINTAYAETREDVDVDFGMFFVWQPDPDLAVAVSVGNEPPVYVPYTDGQWVYSDDGWYFDGATPYEDVTFHYGRWVYNPYAGWVWVPGRVWAPAWVDWYDDDDYIAWTPVPPECYFVDDELSFRPYYYYDDDRYFVCEKSHFCDPAVFRYRTYYRDDGERIWVHDLKRQDGLVVRKNMVIDPGPGVSGIEKHTGRKIEPVNVYRTNDRTEAGLKGNQLKSYSPQFSRVKNSERMNVSNRPKEYVNYNKATNEYSRTAGMKNNQNSNFSENNSSSGKWNVLGNKKQQIERTTGNYSMKNNGNPNSKNGVSKNYSNSTQNNSSQNRFSRKISKNSSGNNNSKKNSNYKGNRNNNSGNSNRKSYNNNSSRNNNHSSNNNPGNNYRSGQKNNNGSRNNSGPRNNGNSNHGSRNNGSNSNGSKNNGNNNHGSPNNSNKGNGNDKQKK